MMMDLALGYETRKLTIQIHLNIDLRLIYGASYYLLTVNQVFYIQIMTMKQITNNQSSFFFINTIILFYVLVLHFKIMLLLHPLLFVAFMFV